MKPYFSKYLPVEGEIEEGDMILNVEVPNQTPFRATCVRSYEPPRDHHYEWYCKKVKLFLCTKEIVVGDTVWNGGQGYLVFEDGSSGRPEGHWMHLGAVTSSHFKVIGEIITPGIKEGQQFTEEEVDYLCIQS